MTNDNPNTALPNVGQLDLARAITNGLGDGLFVLDRAGRIVFANAAAGEILGWPDAALLGQRLAEFVAPNTPLCQALDDPANPLRQVLAAGDVIRDVEAECRQADGRFIPAAYTASPIRRDGQIVGIIFVFRDITARREARKALRRREAQLAAIQALAHIGGWEWDLHTDEVTWTDELFRVYGVEPQERPQSMDSLVDLVHPDDQAAVRELIESTRQGRQPAQNSFRLQSPDGQIRIVQVWVQVDMENGRPRRVWGSVQDITEQKWAEEKSRRAWELAERLINSSMNGIIAYDLDCHYVVWNPVMTRMTGLEAEEVLGRRAFDVFPFLEEIGEDEYFYRALAGEEVFVTNRSYHVPQTGQAGYFEAHYSPLRDEQQAIVGGLIMIRDITRQRQAEAARRRSEQRFRAIFQNAALGILLTNRRGRILQSNAAAQEMLGYEETALQNVNFNDLVGPTFADLYHEHYQRLLAQQVQSIHMELRLRGQDERSGWVQLTASLVRASNKRPNLIIIMLKNIDDRKAIEAELREVQHRLSRSRERERLRLAQDLHDGPIQDLYAAKYQLQYLLNTAVDDDQQQKLQEAQASLQQVNDTLRAICGELRPPTLAPFGLEVAIRSHAEAFQARHPNLIVRLDLTPDEQLLPEAMRLTLFRIYQEALRNVARHAEARNILIRFLINERHVILEVQDDGIGFQVPGRWIVLARQGHLGLVGAAERAEELGGRLVLLSTPEKGTIVRVTAPRPDAGHPQPKAQSTTASPQSQ